MIDTFVNTPIAPAISRESVPHDSPAFTAPDFNRLARIYRWLEYFSFGPFLWRCRIHFLPLLSSCRQALILGDGDGRFTARLLRENRHIAVHAIDGSPRMIDALQKAAAPYRGRITTEVADLRNWSPPRSTQRDLIVSHFFLDCLTSGEVASLTRRLASSLNPDALWLVSEFTIPNTTFGRMIATPLVASLYRVFRLLTGLGPQSLPNYSHAMAQSGWILEQEHKHLCGLLISQVWLLQQSIPASPLPHSSSMKK
jgi:SAM-dependent methyltransferase